MLVLTIACSSARGAVGVALSWCGVALYALGNGPSLGYCFALLARLTEPSAAGMTIVSSALTLGAAMLPAVAGELWDTMDISRHALAMLLLVLLLVPIPLVTCTYVSDVDDAPAPPPIAFRWRAAATRGPEAGRLARPRPGASLRVHV